MKIVYHYHIPKCGGTYVLNLLDQFSMATGGELKSFVNLEKSKKSVSLDNKLMALFKSIQRGNVRTPLLIHHHHGYPGLHELYDMIQHTKRIVKENGGEMVLITTVREPVSFVISRVNFIANKQNPTFSFKTVIEDPDQHNYMAKYILYNHIARWRDNAPVDISCPKLNITLQLFDRIFLQDNLNPLEDFLNNFLGTEGITLDGKLNVGKTPTLPNKHEVDMIRTTNVIDQYLYDYVKEYFSHN